MEYCGLDMGKKSSNFCIVDERRAIVREGKVDNKPDALRKVFGHSTSMRIVIEASTKAFWMADLLEELGHSPIVVDPGRTKAIGSALIKHDKLDARVLAILCAADILAVVQRQTRTERIARMPMTIRDTLVRSRTMLINTVRSVLDSEGVVVRSCATDRFTDIVCNITDDVIAEMATALVPVIDAINALNDKIAEYDELIKATVASDPVAQLLMSAPGVGPLVASAFITIVRDPNRFHSARQVGAYFGLVPSLYESGQTSRRGRVTKHGNRQGRWLLTMAANALLRSKYAGQLRIWGDRIVKRSGRKKAVVALARRLAGVLWTMWKNNTAFDPNYGMIMA